MPSRKTHFTLRLDKSVADKVDAIALRGNCSRSAILEKCIEKYLFEVESDILLFEELDQIIQDGKDDPLVKQFSSLSIDELFKLSEQILKG